MKQKEFEIVVFSKDGQRYKVPVAVHGKIKEKLSQIKKQAKEWTVKNGIIFSEWGWVDGHAPDWGGARTPAPGKTLGPDPIPEDQKRQMASARFAPGTIDRAKAIAEKKGYPGWSRVVDEAILKMAKELGIE
jgi:hypothetical protein